MKYTVAISVIAGFMLALASVTSDAGQGKGGARADRTQQADQERSYDRDRIQDRTRLDTPDRVRDRDMDKDKDRIRDRDRIHTEDPLTLKDKDIYGSELMSEQEMSQYREQMKAAKTRQEREQLQMQHEKRMQERAAKQNKDLVPPGQGKIYGGELMSVQERNEYREQQRLIGTEEGMQKFQAQHREAMQKRAAALGKNIEEAP